MGGGGGGGGGMRGGGGGGEQATLRKVKALKSFLLPLDITVTVYVSHQPLKIIQVDELHMILQKVVVDWPADCFVGPRSILVP